MNKCTLWSKEEFLSAGVNSWCILYLCNLQTSLDAVMLVPKLYFFSRDCYPVSTPRPRIYLHYCLSTCGLNPKEAILNF